MVSSRSQVRHPERHGRSDPNEFHFSPGLAAMEPSIDRHRRQTYFGSGGLSRARPTAGRQAFRAIAYGLIIITVAGVPLAWQFSDDNTKDMVRGWGISLAGLSSIFGVKSFPVAAQTVSKIPDRASTQDAPSPQAVRAAQTAPSPVAAESSAEMPHQFETIVSDLVVVHRFLEQLASKQDQMAQELAALQAVKQSVSQKSSADLKSSVGPPRKNAPKPVSLETPPQSAAAPIPSPRPQEQLAPR
jgi:hypothetical protein